MNIKFRSIFTFSFVLSACAALGHDVPVHRAITANAAASALNDSSSYAGFLNTISSDCDSAAATQSMVLGSDLEDNRVPPIDDGGGNRSYNYFYDPLGPTNSYGKGLSDIPPDIRGKVGLDSFTWASISNGLGYNYHALPFVSIKIAENLNTSNIWSWPNARYYEWLGLTATNQIEKSNV